MKEMCQQLYSLESQTPPGFFHLQIHKLKKKIVYSFCAFGMQWELAELVLRRPRKVNDKSLGSGSKANVARRRSNNVASTLFYKQEASSKALHTTHDPKVTNKMLTFSVKAFPDFTSATSKIDGFFICVLTVHSSVSGPLTLHYLSFYISVSSTFQDLAVSCSFCISSTQQ